VIGLLRRVIQALVGSASHQDPAQRLQAAQQRLKATIPPPSDE
jgi:hypothetical protein